MNIFYLDRDPFTAARYHCDKHVVKMILETAQLLSTAHHLCDTTVDRNILYRPTHVNHPSAIWVRESNSNYQWTWELLYALGREYEERYHKTHLSIKKLLDPLADLPELPNEHRTDPPQCMPDYCKRSDTVEAYRSYYRMEKAMFAKWAYSPTPEWM